MIADYLIGKNPLQREHHWSEIKRALRKYDRMGIGPLDIALWDFAGKYHDSPIHELLGTYRERLPAYASTYQGDRSGGLDLPDGIDADRTVPVPDGLGLGVDYDWDFIELNEVGRREYS